mmetsp:Transcript_42382/g.85246  ORF Transcript_42382/g.85246 Transcript_42382/m.85246 type:complete len:112 (-) Transcript_42382:246-581(-)|eukprot:CAMPEP_0196728870 /NCGR_PEP_ID=MMETSP1091-20130531/9419_1 /TAXON_ID=302021 /ORGANISM="Rhodomonas sp., Strain CCMP768" /LENGTH=111 /DNA_ID=CAMNT_0042071673 /DNA_START=134 /DNA_END=469 /DNA_ORIENTATION=+
MKVDLSTVFTYAFVGGLLIMLIIVIATTPNPTWMDEDDPYTLSGDKSDEEALRGHQHEEHHSAELALRREKMHMPLSSNQLRAVVQARRKAQHLRHKPFFQQGDRVMNTGA